MKPLPPPNGPRMAACWGLWGKAGWAPLGTILAPKCWATDPIHPAASWGGQVPGWYLVRARYLIHRSELGMPTRSCVAILHHTSPAACSSFFDRTLRDSIFCHYNLFFFSLLLLCVRDRVLIRIICSDIVSAETNTQPLDPDIQTLPLLDRPAAACRPLPPK